MNTLIKGLILFFLIALNTGSLKAASSANKQTQKPKVKIIPRPIEIKEHEGFFRITPRTQVLIPEKDKAVLHVAHYFTALIHRAFGISLKTTSSSSSLLQNIILLSLIEKGPFDNDEAYRLSVEKNRIKIEARKACGLFYGIQTLRQLLPASVESERGRAPEEALDIPCLTIKDFPRYRWRGMMLDVSRHFFSKEFVKKFIDYLAMHKLNTFHWHLTDDQGWRIEIKKYPRLTQIGAWRADMEKYHWNARNQQKQNGDAVYGGFYTQEEIREIVSYASDRFITIVPEIEMPGHTSAALAAYPEYSCTGGPFTVLSGGYWPITDIFCAGKDETFAFLEDILTEVMALFPGRYIHIGGDEATKTEWEKCPLCQARIKKECLRDEQELQSYFIRRIERFIASQGKRLIGWDEILEGGLAPQATVMSWRGTSGGIEAARQGHDVIMSPTSHCYFDYYQGERGLEPPAIGGYLPLNRVYAYEPTPPILNTEEAGHILGVQANLWTEYIPTEQHAEYMIFPRIAALSEVAWSPKEEGGWKNFCFRLVKQFDRYREAGIRYARSLYSVSFDTVYVPEKKEMTVNMKTECPNARIRYSLDGKSPHPSSPAYESPVTLDKTTIVRAGIFKEGELQGPETRTTINIHKAINKPVTLTYPYAEKYSAGGAFALTDCLRGTMDHHDGRWQGFESEDLEAVVDLGSDLTIEKISVGFLQNISAWIFLPLEVTFEVSHDGHHFKPAGQLSNTISPRTHRTLIKDFSVSLKEIRGRFIRIRAVNRRTCPEWHIAPGEEAWLFADEIMVEGSE